MKKFVRFITSLKLAILLLVLIAIYSIIGTVIPQNMGQDFYLSNYNSLGNTIIFLQFNKVYSSIIYRILLIIFLINLSGCTVKILPSQLRRMKGDYFPSISIKESESLFVDIKQKENFIKLLRKKRYKIIKKEEEVKAFKHKIGYIGSTVTHIGIIVIIIGSFIGNIYADEGFFNLLPGDIKGFPEYEFSLRLDDFYLEFRDDKTVNQYYSEVSVIESDKEIKKETLWVNNPLKVNSLNIYQTSYGWASKLLIKNNEGKIVHESFLRNQESSFFQPKHLTVLLYGYYPDMVVTSSGEPISMTEKEDNPHYAVILYEFNEHIGSYVIEPGQAIKYDNYEIIFNDSKLYTGLTYRRDFGYLFVVFGSLIIMIGLILSFYINPKYIFIKESEIYTYTKQNSWGFNFKIKRYLEKTLKEGAHNE
jgi:cytochrome c biogenesis protein